MLARWIVATLVPEMTLIQNVYIPRNTPSVYVNKNDRGMFDGCLEHFISEQFCS